MFNKVLGKNPSGKDLEHIRQSPNYSRGVFHNQSPTEVMIKEASLTRMLSDFATKPKSTKPPRPIPSVKTDLKALRSENPVVVWFGHSSYLIKYKGVSILVDPVFSGSASPVPAFARSFPGSDVYKPDDFPEVDVMILTHDHYDHLDYKTIRSFAGRVDHFYVSLGLESHLIYWGVDPSRITSFDWWDTHITAQGFQLTATPARHFSGRSFARFKTLWSSFVLKMDEHLIFLGGDSGYDSHFWEIGERFGPFDLVILESGQYNKQWPYIHLMPEETVKAAHDLKAKLLLPVHWGKFSLAFHDWDEPVKKVIHAAEKSNMNVATPRIGEPLILGENPPQDRWWEF